MDKRPETLAAQALHRIDPETGAVIAPIHPSTTYARGPDSALIGQHQYRRPQGPGSQHAEDIVAALEGAAASRLFASGLGAASALFETVAPGAHVVAQSRMYHGTRLLLRRLAERGRIRLTLFDPEAPETLREAIESGVTELVWIETPANPVWSILDIGACAQIARDAGAVLAVDGTCAPPCTTRALDLGADLVMHSATKYLNGHSDVLAGVVSTREEDARWQRLSENASLNGATPGAFESWLLIRGLRTLFVRFERQSANAMAVAKALEGHPAVSRVLYPGLETHPRHAIAARQMTGGFGGLLSIRLEGGAAAAKKLATTTQVFIQATSIGGVESLIEHRQPIEGPDSPTPEDLVRLSCGIEAEADLVEDLVSALDAL
jgi:cystathionine gamma-synthase